MTICHVGNLPLDEMGDITREIFNRCDGYHDYYHVGVTQFLPIADIYLLHCFKKNSNYYANFERPIQNPNSKIISLIHSSHPCRPSKKSDHIITLTDAAAQHLYLTTDNKSLTIRGSIDLTEFLKVTPDYEFPVIGKISRPEPGKFHDKYFEVLSLLSKKHGARMRFISDTSKLFYPDEAEVITGVKIGHPVSKAAELRKLSIYADAHKTGPEAFVETLCTATIEAMACGLPVVILKTQQPAMAEVVGDGGLIANNIYEFYNACELLMTSESARMEWGTKARKRAQEFNDLDKMIFEWNDLFKSTMDIINEK